MEQQELEKLIHDIQTYLSRAESERAEGEEESENSLALEEVDESTLDEGIFIPSGSRNRMRRYLKFSRVASFLVEVLTIGLFTMGVVSPFESWPRTLMFLTGVLLFGVFTVTMIFGIQARIRLLLSIEANTRQIAVSKERIAETLENLRLE